MAEVTEGCVRCGRQIKVSWWTTLFGQPPVCKDRHGCSYLVAVITSEPPEEDPPVEDSVPEDLYVCPSCRGEGEVYISADWFGVADVTDCTRCEGKGVVLP
jgi:hypothetical protein